MTCEVPISFHEPEVVWRDAEGSPLMIELPAGDFMMGANVDDKFANATERPAHRVRIAAGLAIGCFPVTVGEFRRFSPGHSQDEAPVLPVVRVNWHDANAYCHWLSERTGREYRLASEAEWEYACRGNSGAAFAFGDALTPEQANYLYDEDGLRVGVNCRTPVGSYGANAFGLYDFHGNVCEWVQDGWRPDYSDAPDDGEARNGMDANCRVVRGGAWDYLPRLLRSAWRDWRAADQRADNVGFRVAVRGVKNHAGAR
jgi:formylglycine-generating enzyme required for sulfatase activity